MMANARMQYLIAGLFVISSVAVSTEILDSGPEHHGHQGGSDAAVSDPGHSHGDSDDHHKTPDSPCHHHLMHCCCIHGNSVVAWGSYIPGLDGASSPFFLPTTLPSCEPCSSKVLHVPIV